MTSAAKPEGSAQDRNREPESPCISVCALDENDICMGCYRSADEITDWFMATPAQKWEIIDRSSARRDEDGPRRLL